MSEGTAFRAVAMAATSLHQLRVLSDPSAALRSGLTSVKKNARGASAKAAAGPKLVAKAHRLNVAASATAVAEPEGFQVILKSDIVRRVVRDMASDIDMVVRCVMLQVTLVPTSPIDGQKTGTSGLRKKVRGNRQPHH